MSKALRAPPDSPALTAASTDSANSRIDKLPACGSELTAWSENAAYVGGANEFILNGIAWETARAPSTSPSTAAGRCSAWASTPTAPPPSPSS